MTSVQRVMGSICHACDSVVLGFVKTPTTGPRFTLWCCAIMHPPPSCTLCCLFNLQMIECVRSATHPVSPAPGERNTSVQNVQKVCRSLIWGFHVFKVEYLALLLWWCLRFLPLPGRFLTTQQTCVSKCPGGFFGSHLSSVCEACPPGCLQCADAQHCVRCQTTRKVQLFLQDGQCVSECVRWGISFRAFFLYKWKQRADQSKWSFLFFTPAAMHKSMITYKNKIYIHLI